MSHVTPVVPVDSQGTDATDTTLHAVKVSVVGGSTQYTENTAQAAAPVGEALDLISATAPLPSYVFTDGLNVAARGTQKGELYVKHVDTVPVRGNVTRNLSNVPNFIVPTSPAVATAEIQAVSGITGGPPVENSASVLSTDLQGSLRAEVVPYTTALDYDSLNNPIYYGRAVQGTAKSAASWQIRKLIYDASNNMTDMQFANGSAAFNAIWNNRTSLSYS